MGLRRKYYFSLNMSCFRAPGTFQKNRKMFYKNKKGYYICARNSAPQNSTWRNGRVVECTGLENRRGSHLRGFESLFLRREKTRNESCGFLFSENRQKLAFERLEENKNLKPPPGDLLGFYSGRSLSGITAGNPDKNPSISGRIKE